MAAFYFLLTSFIMFIFLFLLLVHLLSLASLSVTVINFTRRRFILSFCVSFTHLQSSFWCMSTAVNQPTNLLWNCFLNYLETELNKCLAVFVEDWLIGYCLSVYLYRIYFLFSVDNCNRMLNANGVRWLCSRLMDYDPSRQLLFCSVDILWNVLERCTNREQLGAQLNDIRCIRCVDVSRSNDFHFSSTSSSGSWSYDRKRTSGKNCEIFTGITRTYNSMQMYVRVSYH